MCTIGYYDYINNVCLDDYDNVYNKCRAITPVPGGIGPMTIAILLTQLVESSERYYRSTISNL